MTLEDNKSLVRDFYEKVVNAGNVSEVERYVDSSYTEVFDGKRYASGIEGAKQHIIGVRQIYTDLTIEIEKQIAEGEWVVSCITARGIHEGGWLGITPTGKLLVFTGVNIDRVVNGKIVEHGGAANMLEPLLQVGAIKPV